MTCPRCGAPNGAHYAYCFATSLFERLMRAAFEPQPVVSAPQASPDGALDALAGELRAMREDLTRERERSDVLFELLGELDSRHRHEGADPEPGEPQEPQPEDEHGKHEAPDGVLAELAEETEPWWWDGPLVREARASVALDGETQTFGPARPEDVAEVEARFGQSIEELADEAAAGADEASFAGEPALDDETQVRTQEEFVAELAENSADTAEVDRAVLEQVTAQPINRLREELGMRGRRAKAEPSEKPTRQRARIRELIDSSPALNQKKVAELIGLHPGTLSQLLNGKWDTPAAHERLGQALAAAERHVAEETAPPTETETAVDLFLLEAAERAEGEWTSAADIMQAYGSWRRGHLDAPEVTPQALSRRVQRAGYVKAKRSTPDRIGVRGYSGLRLRSLASVGARRSEDEGASEGSDAEGDAGTPASPEGPVLLNPNAERYTHDRDLDAAIEALGPGGVRRQLATYLATETVARGPISPVGVPDDVVASYIQTTPRVVEHPAGWDDLPGRELGHPEIRAMAILLRKEQGWGYKRGRGKPKLRTPEGRVYTLANTPSDFRAAKNARADLRRLGARL